MYFLRILSFLLLLKIFNCYLYPIEYRVPLGGERPAPDSPWPLPRKWFTSKQVLTIDPKTFHFTSNFNHCVVISNSIRRYKNMIFDGKANKSNSLPVLNSVSIEISSNSSCSYPKHTEDESYEIKINSTNNSNSGSIKSHTVWGALRGLETFSQLVYKDQNKNEYYVNVTHIQDWPSYSFRAMHLDTARHYIPIKVILANLDAMAYNKFNVFHWHIVDDQSFPFQSKKYPTLSVKGAYSPKYIYTYEDVGKVIEYARMRGIRVIPEIDSPGHAHGIGKAFPELLTSCYGQGKPNTPNYPHHAARDILNPIRNETYNFMKNLFLEFKQVFKDEYIHLGMDEVYYACWKSNPDIAKFMLKHNMTSYHQVEQHYVTKTIENVRNIGYKYLVYQDPADNNVKLTNDSIVVVWKDKYLDSSKDYWQNYIKKIAKEGYQIVLSACWYLNRIQYPYPGRDWEKLYMCDPKNFSANSHEKSLVVGGEACMWSEFTDGTNILSRLWPRASSVAERLWTNPQFDPVHSSHMNDTRFRLDQHRCRMLRRGIPAAPILNGYCGDYEWDMGSVNDIDVSDRVHLN